MQKDEPANEFRERLAALSPAKRALLERRLQENAAASGVPALSPRIDRGQAPLSFAQSRLWFLNELEPGNTAYHLPHSYRLTGPLEIDALQRGLEEIVRRHEALRTTFPKREGEPIQAIAPAAAFPLPLADWSALAAEDREARAARLEAEHSQLAFDLASGPLLRARLVRLGASDHLLLLNLHHIVCDGWSIGVLHRELSALYAAFREGRSSSLSELPIQYADYAIWQRQWLRGEELERRLAYWRGRLAGAPTLELPTDRPRPLRQTYAGGRRPFTLSRKLTANLKAFNRRETVTPFMSLLAAFQVLLSRYSGQDDIVVGTPVANRGRTELEGLIGFFVNMLVMRGDLSGGPGFRELLARVRRTALDAYQHQDVPFEKLVEALNPVRDMSRHPLFQVLFVLQNAPEHPLELSGTATSRRPSPAGSTPFDLELHLWERGETWSGVFWYNTDLFDPQTVERLAAHYQTLLEGLLADPERPISTLPMLSATERRQLLVEWNDTHRDYPQETCVHHLFEAQVKRSPEAVAVCSADRRLTYRELNARANQLAHHLRRLGVGPETLVGVAVERSPEMATALLGILKAGGAYLPLDPAYPEDRLRFMLADAGARLLLTQGPLRHRLPVAGMVVIDLDDFFRTLAREDAPNPAAAATMNHLAYVLYTSGSTGTPKGVAVPHRALANLLEAMREEIRLDDRDVLLAVTTLSFDIAALELFLPLVTGACAAIAAHATVRDGGLLRQALSSSGATAMQATPATWTLLIEAGWQGDPPLKVLCGGEAMTTALAQQFLARGDRVWNLYGPTETTIWSTAHRVRSAESPVPIGRPLANTRVYILDAHQTPVPVGVRGELFIGGAGLARGYHNRPDLTAERFLTLAVAGEEETRVYRTGDWARYRRDGAIEYLGRVDDLVKIRGFRVEPGEIEAVLDRHPGLRQSAVVAREFAPGDRRLVAYMVAADPQQPPTVEELRHFLKQRLPSYMMPASFVGLGKLPLTANGKVSRRALEAIPLAKSLSTLAYEPPGHPTHALLVQIWEELLQVRPIGIRDDFFDLGGHSLLVVRMMARIEQLLGRTLPISALFAEATIRSLACALAAPAEDQSESPLVEVQAGANRPPFFFLHGDYFGGGLYCRNVARLIGPDQPFYAIHPHGLAGRRSPTTVESMAADNLELVRAVQAEGPYLLGGFCNGAVEAFEMARQLRADGQEVGLLVMIDPPEPNRRTSPSVDSIGEGPLPDPPIAGAAGLPIEAHRLGLLKWSRRVHARYFPQPFPGQITLFQPREMLDGTTDPSRGWRSLAKSGAIHLLPGDHTTTLTRHAAVLAKHWRTCLRQAEQR